MKMEDLLNTAFKHTRKLEAETIKNTKKETKHKTAKLSSIMTQLMAREMLDLGRN